MLELLERNSSPTNNKLNKQRDVANKYDLRWNFNKMNLLWTDPYQTTKIIYFYGGTPLEGPSGNRNRINVTINTSNSNMTGIALYCDSLYSITALNSFSDDNIFKQFYNDLPGINKKAWILSPGCVLDNTFNDTFVSFPA